MAKTFQRISSIIWDIAEYANDGPPFQSYESAFNEAVERMKGTNERKGFLEKERTEQEGWHTVGYYHLSKEEMDLAVEKAKILLERFKTIKHSREYLEIPDDLTKL